jgi:hypothetical protein
VARCACRQDQRRNSRLTFVPIPLLDALPHCLPRDALAADWLDRTGHSVRHVVTLLDLLDDRAKLRATGLRHGRVHNRPLDLPIAAK